MANINKLKLNDMWFDNIEARPHPWPGLCWVTAMIFVPKVEEAIEFYYKAFSAVPIFQLEIDKEEIVFARMRYRGSNFTINKENFDYDALLANDFNQNIPLIFYIYVDDLEKSFQDMQNAGGKVIFPPKEEFWGDKRARLKDPYGYVWDLAEKISNAS